MESVWHCWFDWGFGVYVEGSWEKVYQVGQPWLLSMNAVTKRGDFR